MGVRLFLFLMSKLSPYRYIYICLIVFGTLVSVSSRHWLGIWAGFELNLIGFLPAILYSHKILERERGVKYFIIQAIGSIIILVGSLIHFNLTLFWDYQGSYHDLLSWTLIMSGLVLKLGAFPCHIWLPSVIAGLSWVICFILVRWQKIAPLTLFSQLVARSQKDTSIPIILVCAGSALIGGLSGLNQSLVRVILAYSSIGHLGWLIYASSMRFNLMINYYLIYVLILLTLFYRFSLNGPVSLNNFTNVSSPWILGTIFFVILSLGGIPPLLGFVPKWIVIMNSRNRLSIFVILCLILGSLLNLYYYFSLIFLYFFNTLDLVRKTQISFRLTVFFIWGLNSLGGLGLLVFRAYVYALVIFNKP